MSCESVGRVSAFSACLCGWGVLGTAENCLFWETVGIRFSSVAEELTVRKILRAVEERETKRMTPYTTRLEVADHLGVSRIETDPLFDDAVENGYLEEDPRYKENWRLSDSGRELLDSELFG